MPLYMVRHPEAKVSLVYANSLLELYTATDCGPYVSRRPCTFQEYTKPLCLIFSTETPVLLDRYFSLDIIECPDTESECLDHAEQLLNNGLYSDITLVIDDQEFHCHRAVLANRCEYFKVMFQSDLREGRSTRITLNGHSLLVMTQVLRFIYAGKVTVPRLNSEGLDMKDEGAMDAKEMAVFFDGLLKAADFYGLSSLGKLCERKIAEFCLNKNIYLREEFLSYMYQLATEHKCEDLKCLVAGALSQYLQENVSGKTAQDILETLHPPELSRLVNYLSEQNKHGGIREICDEDIVTNIISTAKSLKTAEIKQALETALEDEDLTTDTLALHTVCKLYMRSNPVHTWRDFWSSILDLFLSFGFDINQSNSEGDTALHIACRGDPDKIMAKTEMSVVLIQWLLRHGANPHLHNKKGLVPLDEAYKHLNQCLPLIASYYYQGEREEGMQFVSRTSLVQDFADKINCLLRHEILLRNAMEEWKEEISPKDQAETSPTHKHSVKADRTVKIELGMDEAEPCDDSDDSEYDNDDHDVTDFQPPNRFVINRAFLTDETFINTSDFHIPPSEFYLDTKFQINNMVGDSENRLDRIKFQNELFKFMYPRLHSELQNMYLNDALDTSDIAAPSKQLEFAATEDCEAAQNIRGSGLPLQSVDTMALLEPVFDDILREATDMCMTSYTELLANITLVS